MSSPNPRLAAALTDRYRLEREIGAGGMATVYVAYDVKHERQVAIKVLRDDLTASLGKDRFLREVRVAAALQHPHVLPLYDSGEIDGLLFYVMPFVDGQSLREKLVKEGELPVGEVIRILRDVADALAEAHRHGIVHRDLKPENIMLRGRHALVMDFGVAKALSEATGRQTLTTVGVALGTPTYMAPEQATADPHVDHRADIYAFGVLAYELLAGRPPFTGVTPQQVLAAHVTAAAQPVAQQRVMPPALANLVMKCLEKKPADRWQSAEELLQQLDAIVTPSGGTEPAASARGLLSSAFGGGTRARIVAGAAIVGVAALVYAGYRAFARPGAAVDRSVAVLTLKTIGADTGAKYLAEGLADGITTSLSGIKRLTVVSRTAVRWLADSTQLTPARLGEMLNAAHLVGGSIQRVGTRLLVTVELVRARSGEQLWTARYDTAASDVLGVQTLVAEAVAGSVAGRLLPAERTQVTRLPTTNPEAYDHYLRGNRLLWSETEATVPGAMAEYEAALNLDSTFTSAVGRLAYTYGVALNWAYRPGGLPIDSVQARGLAAANRAIRGDSLNSDAWLGRGLVLFMRGAAPDLPQASEAFRRAVTLNPSNDAAHQWYGTYLRRTGQFAEAQQEYHRAIAINPKRIQPTSDLGFIAMSQRSFAVAVSWYERSIGIDPSIMSTHMILAHARVGGGDSAGAVRAARDALALASGGERPRGLATLAEMEARAGDRAGATAHFREALRSLGASAGALPSTFGVRDGWEFALAAVALGERETAISILERTRPRGAWLWSYLIFEGFDPIRSDPSFRAIIDASRPPGAKDPR